jgi:hypothetical protein
MSTATYSCLAMFWSCVHLLQVPIDTTTSSSNVGNRISDDFSSRFRSCVVCKIKRGVLTARCTNGQDSLDNVHGDVLVFGHLVHLCECPCAHGRKHILPTLGLVTTSQMHTPVHKNRNTPTPFLLPLPSSPWLPSAPTALSTRLVPSSSHRHSQSPGPPPSRKASLQHSAPSGSSNQSRSPSSFPT